MLMCFTKAETDANIYAYELIGKAADAFYHHGETRLTGSEKAFREITVWGSSSSYPETPILLT